MYELSHYTLEIKMLLNRKTKIIIIKTIDILHKTNA